MGLTVYSRVSTPDRVSIQFALDSGVDGVILPQLENAAHAREVTALAKYPPLGTRGVGFSRTNRYGSMPANFTRNENRRSACFAMVETPTALADAPGIAALETVDGIFIGPADLSMTRGRGPVKGDAADRQDWRRVITAAQAVRKPWAMPAHDQTTLRFARRHGAAFVTVGDDLSALKDGLAAALKMAGR